MSNSSLIRGRLTGVSVEDSTDTSSPSGERQAIVTFVREDTDVTGYGPGQELGKASVWLPNNVPCPLYAANLHFFDLVAGPPSLPLAREFQPKVLVRKDASSDAGTSSCWSVVITPSIIARCKQKWAGAGAITAHAGDLVELDFIDGQDNATLGKLGYFPAFESVASVDVIQPRQLCSVSMRTNVIGTAFPGGHSYAWIVAPLNQGNTCPCKITSGGPGVTYVADFYGFGLTTPTETGVTVTQLMIDSGETIPANTWVIATLVGGQWYVQAPVWLA